MISAERMALNLLRQKSPVHGLIYSTISENNLK